MLVVSDLQSKLYPGRVYLWCNFINLCICLSSTVSSEIWRSQISKVLKCSYQKYHLSFISNKHSLTWGMLKKFCIWFGFSKERCALISNLESNFVFKPRIFYKCNEVYLSPRWFLQLISLTDFHQTLPRMITQSKMLNLKHEKNLIKFAW